MKFYETSEAQTELPRTVTFIVHDFTGTLHDSTSATSTVNVTPVDDLRRN